MIGLAPYTEKELSYIKFKRENGFTEKQICAIIKQRRSIDNNAHFIQTEIWHKINTVFITAFILSFIDESRKDFMPLEDVRKIIMLIACGGASKT